MPCGHFLFQNLPESNPLRMDETRRRNAMMMQVLKEASETTDNIARGFGGSSKWTWNKPEELKPTLTSKTTLVMQMEHEAIGYR